MASDTPRRDTVTQAMKRHALVWGWLRLALGLAQIGLSVGAAVCFLTSGLTPLTWFFIITAMTATVASRTLYRGAKDSKNAE